MAQPSHVQRAVHFLFFLVFYLRHTTSKGHWSRHCQLGLAATGANRGYEKGPTNRVMALVKAAPVPLAEISSYG